jgi:hypothetical protein
MPATGQWLQNVAVAIFCARRSRSGCDLDGMNRELRTAFLRAGALPGATSPDATARFAASHGVAGNDIGDGKDG